MGCTSSKEKLPRRHNANITDDNAQPKPVEQPRAPEPPRAKEPPMPTEPRNSVEPKEVELRKEDESFKTPPRSKLSVEKRQQNITDMSSISTANTKYKMDGPTFNGEVFECFKTGLLYRIVNGNRWAFYNDTQQYEMHVSVVFGADSTLIPLENTKAMKNPDGTHVLSVVVYPGETELFFEGKYDGFKCSMSAKELSADYRKKIFAEAEEVIEAEEDIIREHTNSMDSQTVLESCIKNHILFVDPAFKPSQNSLYREGIDNRKLQVIPWKRPRQYLPKRLHESICKIREINPRCIDQGQLGDCWLLCAIAAMTENHCRIEKLFTHPVSEKIAKKEEDIGAYRVSLNVNGWWSSIIIDDYIPVIGGKPCFAKSVDPAEIWPSLIEKAFAKAFGSYSSIVGGDALFALQDLTGFPVKRFDTEMKESLKDDNKSDDLFKELVRFDDLQYMMILNTPGFDKDNDKSIEDKYKDAGLGMGHAYSLISLKEFPEYGLQLCKIRNPWGNGTEWVGKWGDGDENWKKYPDVAQECNFKHSEDGTFWMEFKDVKKYFDGGGVCFIQPRWFDYRVRGAFSGPVPSLVLEVVVTKPITVALVLSQRDKRFMLHENKKYKYSAIMLSVLRKQDNKQVVHLNSNTDPANPTDKFTFNYARDHSMIYTFEPDRNPYLVVPRIHVPTSSEEVVPFTLGVLSECKIGEGIEIRFKRLEKGCRIFENYPRFVYESDQTPTVDCEFQYSPLQGKPESKRGTDLDF